MTTTDKATLDAVAHIPSSEIRKDIAEMLEEIKQFSNPLGATVAVHGRLSSGYKANISNRKELIKKLRNVLVLRGETEKTL